MASTVSKHIHHEEMINHQNGEIDENSFTFAAKSCKMSDQQSGRSGNSTPRSADGLHKIDRYFLEEFQQLNMDTSGLFRNMMSNEFSRSKHQPSRQPDTAREKTSAIWWNHTGLSESNTKPKSSEFHLANMTAGCELEASDKSECSEDLRSIFLSNLQNRNSFCSRIPVTKLGLLYTDAASSVLTKSFLQRTLDLDGK